MAFNVGSKQDLFGKLRNMAPAKRLDLFNKTKTEGGASPFSMLTAEQFAELFPKYYLKTKPDVAGFQKALSSKPADSKGETYGPHGDTSGKGSAEVDGGKVTNVVRAKEIYDYLRLKGVDHNHAVGIVNNMKYESTFNSGAYNPNDNGGPSGGLFQHHNDRFVSMKNYVGEDWKTNWRKQIDFALTEREMKVYLGKDYANPTDASAGFTRHFEKPADTEGTAASRARTAGGYSDAMGKPGAADAPNTGGGSYETTASGFVVPRDKNLYDSKNEQQCATLAKGFNPNIGKSSSWSIVPGEIKPGMTVATERYNLPGGDRTGSGYHAGVAMTSPDKDGKFWLLEQFSGRKPQLRQVNANSYDGGAMGGTVKFGLIQSNGRVHDEISTEALNYGSNLAPNDDVRRMLLNNQDAGNSGTAGNEQGTGSVQTSPDAQASNETPQTQVQQQEAVKNIQTATIGDMLRFAGDLAGFFMRGEGVGDGSGGVTAADNKFMNKQYVLDEMNKQGVHDPKRRAAMGAVIEGESKFEPKSERDYSTTSNSRIRRIFRSGSRGMTDTQLTNLKSNPQDFFNHMYGPNTKQGKNVGNREATDGWNYRGRGLVQITGRKNYETYGAKIGMKDELLKNPDLANDPKIAAKLAVAFMQDKSQRSKRKDEYLKVARGVGNPVKDTEKVKVASYHENLKTGQFAPGKVAQLPTEPTAKPATQLAELPTTPGSMDITKQPAPTATVTEKPKPGYFDTVKEKVAELKKGIFAGQSVAGEQTIQQKLGIEQQPFNKPLEPVVEKPTPTPTAPPAAEPVQRKQPEIPTGVHTMPDYTNEMPDAVPVDKQSFNIQQAPPAPAPSMAAQPTALGVDKLAGGYFPNPSLERAMQNLTNTGGAAEGHFGGTSLAS